jgi:hypothetical protein
VRDALSAVVTSIPLRSGDVGGRILRLMIGSGSRDCWSLWLGAQTCKQVGAARARSWIIDGVLIDGSDLGRKGNTQPLRVDARTATSKAGAWKADSIRGEAMAGSVVVGSVVSHLSKTASVKAHGIQVVR